MEVKTIQEIINDIQEFASTHNLKIHPGRDLKNWARIVIKEKYHCPCKPKRPGCPCAEALDDIERLNCCACRLFVNDDYLHEYYALMEKRRSKNQRRG